MQEVTMIELFRLTKSELLRFEYEMVKALLDYPEQTEEHAIAYYNLRLTRRELGRRDFAPH